VLLHPKTAVGWVASGKAPRDLLSLALWRETAQWFGIDEIDLDAETRARPMRGRRQRSPSKRRRGIGLLMIAQNEAAYIGAALESVQSLVDEAVVVDGGSTDDTVEIAERFGAKVVHRPFSDDFAAQRNVGLDALSTPLAFMLDADEVITPGLSLLLADAAATSDAEMVFVPRLNLVTDEVDHVWGWPDMQARMFPSGLRYEGRLHEKVVGWRTRLDFPLTGPYLLHRKPLRRALRTWLSYYELDPSWNSPQDIAWVRERLAQLEAADGPDQPA
jgi:hypothetical protein